MSVRLLWFVVAVAFVAAVYGLQTKYERAIAASQTEIETLYRDTVKNERVVAHARALRAAQATAEADLKSVSHEGSLPAATAAMLLALQEQATRYHVSVVSLQPGSTVTERRLTATQLTLRMRGRFVDVIAFVQHISTASAVISVSRTDLAVSSQADTMRDPQLDATVHATLYRLQSVDLMGDSTVASSR